MSAPGETYLYPIFLKLEGRAVLVVGGGAVAERKIDALLHARARVRVVAPTATPEVQRLAQAGALEWQQRPFEAADVAEVWLVVAATGDADVQRRVAAEAQRLRVFAVAVDDPANASAFSGSAVRRPPFTIAISSSGATPALTRLVREVVEHVLPENEWIEHAKRLRAQWLAAGTPPGERFADLVREIAAQKR